MAITRTYIFNVCNEQLQPQGIGRNDSCLAGKVDRLTLSL